MLSFSTICALSNVLFQCAHRIFISEADLKEGHSQHEGSTSRNGHHTVKGLFMSPKGSSHAINGSLAAPNGSLCRGKVHSRPQTASPAAKCCTHAFEMFFTLPKALLCSFGILSHHSFIVHCYAFNKAVKKKLNKKWLNFNIFIPFKCAGISNFVGLLCHVFRIRKPFLHKNVRGKIFRKLLFCMVVIGRT